jgi:hypothetical protein
MQCKTEKALKVYLEMWDAEEVQLWKKKSKHLEGCNHMSSYGKLAKPEYLEPLEDFSVWMMNLRSCSRPSSHGDVNYHIFSRFPLSDATNNAFSRIVCNWPSWEEGISMLWTIDKPGKHK